jgi:MurNAc alpha-1-phosphate uridylyltransferase
MQKMTSHSGQSPVKAMILAAGRGERMRPLTDTTPKPLLVVQGKPLIKWPLEALAQAGFCEVVVNTDWLGDQIENYFLSLFGPEANRDVLNQLFNNEHSTIAYSHEGRDFGGALETAGGIARALPLLCPSQDEAVRDQAFWVLAGDVFAPDFVFSQAAVDRFMASGKLAHVWLVPNPAHNPGGDFGLALGAGERVGLALNLPKNDPQPRYTYSTIGLYRRAFFEPPLCNIASGNPLGIKAPLAPLLRAAMDNQAVSAEIYTGAWTDVGTPERLAQLNHIPE